MATIQIRRGTAAAWTAENPVLESGEFGLETDTGKTKIGNGATAWNSLSYNYVTYAQIDVSGATNGQALVHNGTKFAPAALGKSTVGLGNVDNTSDVNKPISTATQSALDLKAPLSSPTFTGTATTSNLIVSGNLTVSGTTTSINTETLTVDDNIIVLNNNVTSSPTENAGIEVERGSSTNVQIRWNETTDKWQFSNNGSTFYDIAAEVSDTLLDGGTPTTLQFNVLAPVINAGGI